MSLTPVVFSAFNTAKPGPAGQRNGEHAQRHLLSGLLSTERVKSILIYAGSAACSWVS